MYESPDFPHTGATYDNMVKWDEMRHPGEEYAIAYSPFTGEEYSANPGDYWEGFEGILRDVDGEPMYLVRKFTIHVDVEDVA